MPIIPCPHCEARPGDNPVCIWTGELHDWAPRTAWYVYCEEHAGGHLRMPTCVHPHDIGPSARIPSMTAVETLDPREGVTA